ncbi:MAG TPA: exopolysaccharide biosynthesis polyprenyl glycosylphosphotransferase [Longimicrobiales bacterium]
MRIGSKDVRYGADAAFFLSLRTTLRDAARGAALVGLDACALAVASRAVRWLGVLGLLPAGGAGAVPGWLFGYTAILSLAAFGGYRAGDDGKSPRRVAGAVCFAGFVHAVFVPAIGGAVPWVRHIVLTCAAMLAVLQFRQWCDRVLQRRRTRSVRRRVVLVGGGDTAQLDQIRLAGEEVAVLGRVGTGREEERVGGLGAALAEVLAGGAAERVVILDPLPASELDAVVGTAVRRGVPVEAWHPRGSAEHRPVVRTEHGYPVVAWLPARPGVPRMALKRAMDVAVAAAALVLTSPLLVLIAAAIRLDSPGPVLFGQIRVGVGGKPFRMWKFRTMVPDAERMKPALAYLNESGDSRLFKIPHDPRVTRLGRWLRRTSLDELPQLLNVLRGEMSLVGPRPFFPDDLRHYEPHHFERLTVLPGITGLWQVSGRSDVRDFETVVRLDREYIRHWSLGLDLRILARTIPAVLRRDGAM